MIGTAYLVERRGFICAYNWYDEARTRILIEVRRPHQRRIVYTIMLAPYADTVLRLPEQAERDRPSMRHRLYVVLGAACRLLGINRRIIHVPGDLLAVLTDGTAKNTPEPEIQAARRLLGLPTGALNHDRRNL